MVEMDAREAAVEKTSRLVNVADVLVSVSVHPELQASTLSAFDALLEQLAGQSLTQEVTDLTERLISSLCRAVDKTGSQTGSGPELVFDTVLKRILILCISPTLTNTKPDIARHLFLEEAVFTQCLSLFKTFSLCTNRNSKCVSHNTIMCMIRTLPFFIQHR